MQRRSRFSLNILTGRLLPALAGIPVGQKAYALEHALRSISEARKVYYWPGNF